ncbi:unnamed protein product [Hapterophycus canaliculatus]
MVETAAVSEEETAAVPLEEMAAVSVAGADGEGGSGDQRLLRPGQAATKRWHERRRSVPLSPSPDICSVWHPGSRRLLLEAECLWCSQRYHSYEVSTIVSGCSLQRDQLFQPSVSGRRVDR